MTYLTEKEIAFINALKEDHQARREKSFASTIFLGATFSDEPEFFERLPHYIDIEGLKSCNDLFGYELLSNIDWVMEIIESQFIGKYKNYFIVTDSEGGYSIMLKDIQNLPYTILDERISNPNDSDELLRLIEYFQNDDIDFLQYLEDYKQFCLALGFTYNPNEKEIKKQVDNFLDETNTHELYNQ